MHEVRSKGYTHITLLISGSFAVCSVLACIITKAVLDHFLCILQILSIRTEQNPPVRNFLKSCPSKITHAAVFLPI